MKFIQKKAQRGRPYYYFQFPLKGTKGQKKFSRYLGTSIPKDLAEKIPLYAESAAETAMTYLPQKIFRSFAPKSILPIEQAKFWYQGLHHELLEPDLRLFHTLFALLFLLNSNRAEGSKVTREDMENFLRRRRRKPKTPFDREIMNSFAALKFAFSKEMKWNIKSIKRIHALLLQEIAPKEIVGTFKKVNVVVGNERTIEWPLVRKKLQELLAWLKKQKHLYPPIAALEFHYRFEHIHPFRDGNGRVGRLLFNAYLLKQGYMPVIFFSENHESYCNALTQTINGRPRKLAHYLLQQIQKTRRAIERYKTSGIIRGGSPLVGQWEIERGRIRKF